MEILKVENLCKIYGKGNNQVQALNDVSFSVEKGEFVAVLGHNGSGKSTTMRMIATLMKQDKGIITVNGINTSDNPAEARKQIGVLLGGDVSLYDRLTARENILYFADLQGVEREVADKRIQELSSLLDMDDFLDRRVAGFSRGMRQKVAFVRSIIHDPDILLLDEPSTGLDINSIKDVQDFILFCRNRKKTILLSTHNAHEMEFLCDNIVFIDEGKIIAKGKKEDLLRENNCEHVTDMFFRLRERREVR